MKTNANLAMSADTNRPGSWFETYMGHQFYVLDPRAEDICIEDIAHSLARVVRYRGHCQRWYSVAEHSVHVADVANMQGGTPTEVLRALLHDAAEAYTGDVPSPIKASIPQLQESDAAIERVIMDKFEVPVKFPTWVKKIDANIIVDERLAIMRPSGNVWGTDHLPPLGVNIRCWNPEQAEAEFLLSFYSLILQRQRHTEWTNQK